MLRKFRAKTCAIAMIAALSLMSSLQAQAAPLAPLATHLPAFGEFDLLGGSIEASMTTPFSAPTFSGTLTSTVISGDMTNPLGGLTFTYLLSNDLASPHPLGRLTLNGWDGWLTDVSYTLTSIGVRPGIVNRPVSDVIGFTFMDILGDGLVPAGKESRLLVVQTNAPSFIENIASIIDGSVTTSPTFSPVPEPATLGMMGVGLVALAFRRKR